MATAIVLVQAWLAYSTGVSGDAVIIVTLLSTALLGAATAPLTSASYSLASYLPPAYIQVRTQPVPTQLRIRSVAGFILLWLLFPQALVLGQSLAGVATSVLSFATIWTSAASQHELPTPEDVQPAAVQYFVVCAAVVALGLVGYVTLPHMHFVQHWTLRDGELNACIHRFMCVRWADSLTAKRNNNASPCLCLQSRNLVLPTMSAFHSSRTAASRMYKQLSQIWSPRAEQFRLGECFPGHPSRYGAPVADISSAPFEKPIIAACTELA